MPDTVEPDEALRKLDWRIKHPPVYKQGVSEAALQTMREFVGEAQSADPSVFAKGGDPAARKHLRMLAALIPDTVPDERLARVICDVVANPHLDVEDVRDVLDTPWRQELPAPTLRKVGSLLRAGVSRAETARQVGVHRSVVIEVAAWLGVAEAREEALKDAAIEALEEGHEPDTLAVSMSVSEGRARRVMLDVADALDMEPSWA